MSNTLTLLYCRWAFRSKKGGRPLFVTVHTLYQGTTKSRELYPFFRGIKFRFIFFLEGLLEDFLSLCIQLSAIVYSFLPCLFPACRRLAILQESERLWSFWKWSQVFVFRLTCLASIFECYPKFRINSSFPISISLITYFMHTEIWKTSSFRLFQRGVNSNPDQELAKLSRGR